MITTKTASTRRSIAAAGASVSYLPAPQKSRATVPAEDRVPGAGELLAEVGDGELLLITAHVAAETRRRGWPAAADDDRDGELVALCGSFRELAAIDTSDAEDAGLVEAQLRRQERSVRKIAAAPAHTGRGLAAKLAVLASWEHWGSRGGVRPNAAERLMDSLAADAARLGAAV
ncbi:MAG: hypothetical protein AB7P12_07980 [Alphaproteobacteria bacterium]